MTKSEQRCLEKCRFETRDKARQFAERRREQYGPQKAYHCPHCSGWHVTSAKRPVVVKQPAPVQKTIGKRNLMALAVELVDLAEQKFRYESGESVRVVLDLPAEAWDRIAAVRRTM